MASICKLCVAAGQAPAAMDAAAYGEHMRIAHAATAGAWDREADSRYESHAPISAAEFTEISYRIHNLVTAAGEALAFLKNTNADPRLIERLEAAIAGRLEPDPGAVDAVDKVGNPPKEKDDAAS